MFVGRKPIYNFSRLIPWSVAFKVLPIKNQNLRHILHIFFLSVFLWLAFLIFSHFFRFATLCHFPTVYFLSALFLCLSSFSLSSSLSFLSKFIAYPSLTLPHSAILSHLPFFQTSFNLHLAVSSFELIFLLATTIRVIKPKAVILCNFFKHRSDELWYQLILATKYVWKITKIRIQHSRALCWKQS